MHISAYSACLERIKPRAAMTSAVEGSNEFDGSNFRHTFNFVQSEGWVTAVRSTSEELSVPVVLSVMSLRDREGASSVNAHCYGRIGSW